MKTSKVKQKKLFPSAIRMAFELGMGIIRYQLQTHLPRFGFQLTHIQRNKRRKTRCCIYSWYPKSCSPLGFLLQFAWYSNFTSTAFVINSNWIFWPSFGSKFDPQPETHEKNDPLLQLLGIPKWRSPRGILLLFAWNSNLALTVFIIDYYYILFLFTIFLQVLSLSDCHHQKSLLLQTFSMFLFRTCSSKVNVV